MGVYRMQKLTIWRWGGGYWWQCDQIGWFITLLGNFLKSLATIILAQITQIVDFSLGNFKKTKIFYFSSENYFGNFWTTFCRL